MNDEPTSRGATILRPPASTRPTVAAARPPSAEGAPGPFSQVPDLIMLAQAVAAHGIAAHEADLSRLAEQARQLGLRSGALEALEDLGAGDVVRARALAVVLSQLRRWDGRRWDGV